MTIINLKTTEFDKFIATAEVPVVVDYWATWCAPCKMVLPILEELSTDYEGKVIIVKVDVDAEPELMDGIRSIPTIRVFQSGKKVKEIVGAKNKPALLKELEDYLGQNTDMPTYDYTCSNEHVYTEERSIHEDQKVTECPECKETLKRIFIAVPVTFQAPGFYASERKSLGL